VSALITSAVRLPQNDLPVLSDYDKQCLALLAEDYEIDFLSLSYTRSAADVQDARRSLAQLGLPATKIFAKLETREGLLNLKGILSEVCSQAWAGLGAGCAVLGAAV
jgi:pyruvate kinase